jgi:hypothetical protein
LEGKKLDFVLTGERLLGVSKKLVVCEEPGACEGLGNFKEGELPRIKAGFSFNLSELERELERFWVPFFALDLGVPFFLTTELILFGLDLEGFEDLELCVPALVRSLLFFDINNRSEISS